MWFTFVASFGSQSTVPVKKLLHWFLLFALVSFFETNHCAIPFPLADDCPLDTEEIEKACCLELEETSRLLEGFQAHLCSGGNAPALPYLGCGLPGLAYLLSLYERQCASAKSYAAHEWQRLSKLPLYILYCDLKGFLPA